MYRMTEVRSISQQKGDMHELNWIYVIALEGKGLQVDTMRGKPGWTVRSFCMFFLQWVLDVLDSGRIELDRYIMDQL